MQYFYEDRNDRNYRNYRNYENNRNQWNYPYLQQPVILQPNRYNDYRNLMRTHQPLMTAASCFFFFLLIIFMIMAFNKRN